MRTWLRKSELTTLCAVFALVCPLLINSAAGAAERFEAASWNGRDEIVHDARLPTVLGRLDASRYRAIFALQSEGDWAAADHQIALLHDRLLLGRVLAQRYLHRSYKASFEELRRWLDAYADLPDAGAIRALAVKRRPDGSDDLPRPERTPIALRGVLDDPADLRPSDRTPSSEAAARSRAAIRALSRSDPNFAERLLREAASERLLDKTDFDEAQADVVEGYLFNGESRQALALTGATRTAVYRPLAEWHAGLAAWRLHRPGEAFRHFETLARLPDLSRWTESAAAFWAARAASRNHRPDLATHWLGVAAEHKRTFYGLLARRVLGIETGFDFEPAIFTDIDLNAVVGLPAARRALALLQAGARQAAELELRGLASGAPFTLYPALAALAERGNMPALSLQLATMLSALDGTRHDPTLYPLPRWQPAGGFAVDRALLFAFVRQESEFLPEARSTAGAVGLMQLMPATAREMAGRIGVELETHGKHGSLTDPAINLALGQEFLGCLLKNDQINGSLILLAAAYNGGPGNLQRWQARPEYRADPLLFVESLPARETRIFVKRVLTNYWVYRMRLDQPTRDLDALAAGEWPVYVALDDDPDQVTRHVAAR